MSGCWKAKYMIVGALAVAGGLKSLSAQEHWGVHDGTLTLTLSRDALAALDLTVVDPAYETLSSDMPLTVELSIDGETGLGFRANLDEVEDLYGLHLRADESIAIGTVNGVYWVMDFELITGEAVAAALTSEHSMGPGYLELAGLKWAFHPASRTFGLASREVRISRALAEVVGLPGLAGRSIGRAEFEAQARWMAGQVPPRQSMLAGSEGSVARDIGPDMTFCQLYGLAQYGRVGDVVGLSVATTAWNVGDAVVPWLGMPNPNHPFIVMDLYRLKTVEGSQRLEQIGQSWIKHAFCALDSSQCSTQCQGTGCASLGIGCTDTYHATLNAGQNGLGPRCEVDPWARGWTYDGSHNSQGIHSHNWIEHRLQVHDADLDPAQNSGATYYVSSFYICPEDVNQMNSAAWKVATVSGAPGGIWTFGTSGLSTLPETGFPIDAWTGATQTVLAQEVPVVEFVSPDGRCILSAEVTDLGDGMWHYEYALLNVDMNRKISSFSIPVTEDLTVSNVGFHAVESHGEPYSNDPWVAEFADWAITWSTADNPLRWGTMYNFRFDASSGPVENAVVTLGLYEPGLPLSVSGVTLGPTPGEVDCNQNEIPDPCDLDCGADGGVCDLPGCGQSMDCNDDGIPDECSGDCNENGSADVCDIHEGTSQDCNGNSVPDECDPDDCNGNGVPDICDLVDGTSEDCNDNWIPDVCDIEAGTSEDCDGSEVPDECEVLDDTDEDGIVDCYDLCPETTAEGGCVCPPYGMCLLNGVEIPNYSWELCLKLGGIPDCLEAPCHDGCLIGDGDEDGDLDLVDFSLLLGCYSGAAYDPENPPSETCRFLFNYNDGEDLDIDLEDHYRFGELMTGPGP